MSEDHLDAGRLFQLHAPFVVRFLARLGVRGSDLDDMVQEVFLVAHRKGGFGEDAARARPWLAAIGLRVARTMRRGEGRRARRMSEVVSAGVPDSPAPDADVERAEALRRVDSVLSKMDIDHRTVFVLHEMEGATTEAIASALGVPIGTVYSRLRSARKRFLKAYGRFEAREHGLVARLTRRGA